ncbi:hypothetical protein [Methanosarcina sp. KYL-1]|uniref:hypothetical protein n=1 Tax=Methanosarcina sp. KYL-1 TaxID=2602068 RepID=UPI0021014DD9|nr:hypothetical protein [Methanosarcina sp. KYL-1]
MWLRILIREIPSFRIPSFRIPSSSNDGFLDGYSLAKAIYIINRKYISVSLTQKKGIAKLKQGDPEDEQNSEKNFS